MPDHRVAVLGIAAIGILGQQHRDRGCNRLGQEPLGSLASDCR